MNEQLQKKVDRAIEMLQFFEPKTEPYYLCYSGGKDSDCIRILAEMAGVRHEVHNNHTTVDAPETVRYIREVMSQYGEKKHYIDSDGCRVTQYGEKGFVHYPKLTMWQLIVKKRMPPTRIVRYCCAELKEKGGRGRMKIAGVRWAESANRRESHGIITIIGKPKDTIKKAEDVNANFRLTNKGGGLKSR